MNEYEFEESRAKDVSHACGFDAELLSAWLDGELDDDEATGVGDHIAACRDCASELESLRHANEQFCKFVVRAIPDRSNPVPGFVSRSVVGSTASQIANGSSSKSRSRYPSRWLTALTLACLVGLCAFLVLRDRPDAVDGIRFASDSLNVAMTKVAEPLGEMVSTNNTIRAQQVRYARTMQQELRLLNLMARSLPENEKSLAVQSEINELLEKARRLGLDNEFNSLEK